MTIAQGDLVQDQLHLALREARDFDQRPLVASAIRSALLDLVDALAFADDNPNRAEYIATLAELHRDDPDPLTAMVTTAASWLRDHVDQPIPYALTEATDG